MRCRCGRPGQLSESVMAGEWWSCPLHSWFVPSSGPRPNDSFETVVRENAEKYPEIYDSKATAPSGLDDYLSSELVRGIMDPIFASPAQMKRLITTMRLQDTAPENEGAENRFHRAGCDRLTVKDDRARFHSPGAEL